MRIVSVFALLFVLSATLAAQTPELVISETEEIPEDYETAVLDLVERYEEMRRRLRAEIERNAELYTQEELDAAVVEVQQELDHVLAQLEAAEDEHKALRRALDDERQDALRYKAALAKSRADFDEEIDTLETVIAGTEEESLIQLGATFSPAGSLGALGILNLPQTNVSLLAGTNYLLREQELNAFFGVTLSFLPQQVLRERWERLGNRFENRAVDKSAAQ
ncbi:MAG: hypothetical protein WD492_11905 [Alkalispirochaeta sp.]